MTRGLRRLRVQQPPRHRPHLVEELSCALELGLVERRMAGEHGQMAPRLERLSVRRPPPCQPIATTTPGTFRKMRRDSSR